MNIYFNTLNLDNLSAYVICIQRQLVNAKYIQEL